MNGIDTPLPRRFTDGLAGTGPSSVTARDVRDPPDAGHATAPPS